MSKIALSGNASGTGTFSIASPGTNSDRTLTLPDASGEVVINPSLAGMVATFAMNTPPAGWLKADGAAVSRTTYAALFTAIGTTFGVGDGSTTFNLPDLRGEFMRGWDDGRGIDTGRVFGSAQADEFKAHTHTPLNGNSFLTNTTAGSQGTFNYGSGALVNTGTVSTTSSVGSTETRPRNIALLACIKF
jgi:microcystin-dependent protein